MGLLQRYRPVLRYDRDERYHAQPVARPLEVPRLRSGERVYGHVAEKGGETWLQYWLFYAYNPQDRGILHTGRHEGDWELVQFRVGRRGKPDLATLAQHSWAEGCRWHVSSCSSGAAARGCGGGHKDRGLSSSLTTSANL